MSKSEIHPTTIRGVKRLARDLKAARGLAHAGALDEAASLAGFENYAHARRTLPLHGAERRAAAVRLSVAWLVPNGTAAGREEVALRLRTSVADLIRPPRNGCQDSRIFGLEIVARDSIRRAETESSQSWAREVACVLARKLTFMDVTGLRPTSVEDGMWPGGDWLNELPGADHSSFWIDPTSGTLVTVDEPYELPLAGIPGYRSAWAAEHGWSLARSRFWGMHAPGCRLYMSTKSGSAYDLDAACAALDELPPPLQAERWGECPNASSHVEPSSNVSV